MRIGRAVRSLNSKTCVLSTSPHMGSDAPENLLSAPAVWSPMGGTLPKLFEYAQGDFERISAHSFSDHFVNSFVSQKFAAKSGVATRRIQMRAIRRFLQSMASIDRTGP
jgi:hypothetical protein